MKPKLLLAGSEEERIIELVGNYLSLHGFEVHCARQVKELPARLDDFMYSILILHLGSENYGGRSRMFDAKGRNKNSSPATIVLRSERSSPCGHSLDAEEIPSTCEGAFLTLDLWDFLDEIQTL